MGRAVKPWQESSRWTTGVQEAGCASRRSRRRRRAGRGWRERREQDEWDGKELAVEQRQPRGDPEERAGEEEQGARACQVSGGCGLQQRDKRCAARYSRCCEPKEWEENDAQRQSWNVGEDVLCSVSKERASRRNGRVSTRKIKPSRMIQDRSILARAGMRLAMRK